MCPGCNHRHVGCIPCAHVQAGRIKELMVLFEHMCDSLWLLPETWALNNMYEACVLGGRCSTAQSATFAMQCAQLARLASCG